MPAPIWAEFMTYVHDGLPVHRLPTGAGQHQEVVGAATHDPADVIGLSRDSAVSKLREAKLNALVQDVPSLEPEGTVVNQSPGGGSTVRQGSFVTIHVSTGEIPTGALPNLSGLTFDEALEIVRSFEDDTGVRVNLIQENIGTTDPALVGRIVTTNPPPATAVQGAVDVLALIGVLEEEPPPPPESPTTTEPPDND